MTQKSASFEWGPEQKKFSAASLSYSASICAFWAIWFAGPHDVGGVNGGESCCVREKKDSVPKKEIEVLLS